MIEGFLLLARQSNIKKVFIINRRTLSLLLKLLN